MKNRRNVVIAFLLIAVLCLGVGFAAVSDDLQAYGTMSVTGSDLQDDFNAAVHFANPAADTTGVTATVGADANGDADDKLTITVPAGVFTTQGQEIVVTVDIENDNAAQSANITFADATFAGDVPADNPFTVTVTPSNAAATNIDAMGTQPYTITIKLVKIPADDITDATFTIDFTATPGE